MFAYIKDDYFLSAGRARARRARARAWREFIASGLCHARLARLVEQERRERVGARGEVTLRARHGAARRLTRNAV